MDELVDEWGEFPKSTDEQTWWLVGPSKTNKLNKRREKVFSLSSFFCIFVVFPLEIRKALGASTAGNQTRSPYRDRLIPG